jgi:heme/copper-type cytochrome/quinol oxidase subunit 2
MTKTNKLIMAMMLGVAVLPGVVSMIAAPPRVIEVIADKDNKFKVPGKKDPVITMKAGEVATLKITARKGEEMDMKDNAVHSFTIVSLKGTGSWDFRLKEGVNTFNVVAPDPGEYKIECAVKCGKGHDDMNMKLVVTP